VIFNLALLILFKLLPIVLVLTWTRALKPKLLWVESWQDINMIFAARELGFKALGKTLAPANNHGAFISLQVNGNG
jgi:hypothetical protein